MSYHPGRILTPVESRKRKERGGEEFHYNYNQPKAAKLKGEEPPTLDNRLLAGYMAYEFLTKGSLLGQQYKPGRAAVEPTMEEQEAGYAEVASILKTDGAHIPGILNPTQLSRWIRM